MMLIKMVDFLQRHVADVVVSIFTTRVSVELFGAFYIIT